MRLQYTAHNAVSSLALTENQNTPRRFICRCGCSSRNLVAVAGAEPSLTPELEPPPEPESLPELELLPPFGMASGAVSLLLCHLDLQVTAVLGLLVQGSVSWDRSPLGKEPERPHFRRPPLPRERDAAWPSATP